MPPPVAGSEVCRIGRDVQVGTGSVVEGRKVVIGDGTRIGNGVSVHADEVYIGARCEIEDSVRVFRDGGGLRQFRLGDCGYIGSDCKICARELVCGDYVTIHNHVLVNGGATCCIGHNSYLGQGCIINANRPVTIGNGVGIVAYSAIWTHGKFGEAIEGSLVHKEEPVVVEDDVTMWRAIVSPGVKIGRRATVFNGSTVTRDVKAYSVVGGTPAHDLGFKAYRPVALQEKFAMMGDFAVEFLETGFPGEWTASGRGRYDVVPNGSEKFRLLVREELDPSMVEEGLTTIAVTLRSSAPVDEASRLSVFNVSSKTYTKKLTEPEVRFMRFLLDARARFVPADSPRLDYIARAGEPLTGQVF